MKDLPKVFKNNIDKKFNNNENLYYSSRNSNTEEIIDDNKTILQKISFSELCL